MSDYALAHADTDALSLRRMADLEAHPQIVGAVVEQHDGKDAVVDHRAYKVSRALQQSLEVKRRIQRICQPDEEFRLQRFDAHLYLWRSRRRSWPIVALKVGARISALRDLGSGTLLYRHVPALRLALALWSRNSCQAHWTHEE